MGWEWVGEGVKGRGNGMYKGPMEGKIFYVPGKVMCLEYSR